MNNNLLEELDKEIAHQNLWRKIMSITYFVISGAAIIFSGTATIFAGLQQATYAAWLAGIATVLFGLEKSMLFREKWMHHLTTVSQLTALRLSYLYGQLNQQEVSERMGQLLTEYAAGLPVSQRAAPSGGCSEEATVPVASGSKTD